MFFLLLLWQLVFLILTLLDLLLLGLSGHIPPWPQSLMAACLLNFFLVCYPNSLILAMPAPSCTGTFVLRTEASVWE